jgi:hypothetical protein
MSLKFSLLIFLFFFLSLCSLSSLLTHGWRSLVLTHSYAERVFFVCNGRISLERHCCIYSGCCEETQVHEPCDSNISSVHSYVLSVYNLLLYAAFCSLACIVRHGFGRSTTKGPACQGGCAVLASVAQDDYRLLYAILNRSNSNKN